MFGTLITLKKADLERMNIPTSRNDGSVFLQFDCSHHPCLHETIHERESPTEKFIMDGKFHPDKSGHVMAIKKQIINT